MSQVHKIVWKYKVRALIFTALIFIAEPRAQVVDPATNAQLAQLNATETKSLIQQFQDAMVYKKLLELRKKLEQARNDIAWAKKLQTVRNIEELINLMVCTNQEMEFMLKYVDSEDCLTKIDINLILLQQEASMDFLYLIIGAGLSIEPGERIKTLDDVIRNMKESHALMRRLNSSIRLSVRENIINGNNKKILKTDYTTYRY